MQSRVFRPLVYSIIMGFRVRLLTNHGSDLMSPVYRMALFSFSITERMISEEKMGSVGSLTKHDRPRAVISIEERDLNIISRR